VSGYECPRCHACLTVRLEPGETCPDCRSADAWQDYREKKLVLDREALAAAVPADAPAPPTPPRRYMLPLTAAIAGAVCLWATLANFSGTRLGPLALLQAQWLAVAKGTALAGLLTLTLAIVAVVRLRRSRLFRSLPLLALSLGATVAAAAALVIGGAFWLQSTHLFGWEHVSMPALQPRSGSPQTRAIMNATAVILAPDGNGDARGIAIGSGAVISSVGDRTWIVTCSHVAMPYAATAAFRDAAAAHAVWVYFSDGRHAEGRVSWVAQPPLDVAIVSVRIPAPPAPVPVSPDAGAIGANAPVCFVPNPFRNGWLSRYGKVLKREPHSTPAGDFSLFLTDLPVQPGDSGTGLFDSRGHLIGLNFYMRSDRGKPQVISLPAETMERVMHLIRSDELGRLDRR
jgi:RNA polymerase subunit RPABC4/transcription elongation factor Spt4